MKLFARLGPGHIGLNYMWLPTWIGLNQALIQEIEAHASRLFVGKELTEETLEAAHNAAISFLVNKFPQIPGLFDYLDGLKYVEPHGSDAQEENGQVAHPPG